MAQAITPLSHLILSMREVPDSHVMRETLRVGPLRENTLERA